MVDERSQISSPLQSIGVLLFFLLLAAGGFYLAPKLMPAPKIGIIRLNYEIFSVTTHEITSQLALARQDPSIKGVVIIINSPGGSAAYSEELYLDVLHTRNTIPVVASIDLLAASGAYYMAAGANEIYAKPTSGVGSIGVIASLPGPVFIEDDLLTTGPYKAFGGTRDGVVRQIEMAKFSFLQAIAAGRGERLTVSLDYLSRAEIYTGVQAQQMGLIDGLKATDEAIAQAAALAGLNNYETVELYPLVYPDGNPATNGQSFQYRVQQIDPDLLWAAPTDLPVGLYYRYMDPAANR